MKKIKVIAELGINHNGDLNLAKEMIFQSKLAGADFVKFQKRTVSVVYAGELDKPRNDGNPYGWKTYGEQKRGLEFGADEYYQIDKWCRDFDIPWLSSAWDDGSLLFLEKFGVNWHKIASAMVTNLEFVKSVARLGKFTIISTGGCTMDEIDSAVQIFKLHSCPFALLHCVSTYPCRDEDCNLLMINTLKLRYPGKQIGYSGHEVGILPSVLAMALGATIIERHVTMDRSMYGSDQSASLEFTGLRRLCDYARIAPLALGDGIKRVSAEEQAVMQKLRYWMV